MKLLMRWTKLVVKVTKSAGRREIGTLKLAACTKDADSKFGMIISCKPKIMRNRLISAGIRQSRPFIQPGLILVQKWSENW